MLAYLENTTWTRWTGQPRPLNGAGSYQLPRNAEAIYSDDELSAYGLVRVTPAEVPDGQRVVSSAIADQDGAPVEVLELEDIPAPVLTRIPKDMIWRRATDAEAEQMQAALDAQPVRLRNIYAGATWIETTDELFGTLQAALVGLFGKARAAELLAPTD